MAEFAAQESRDGVRMPWNIIPGTDHEAANCVVPISAVYTPIKPIPHVPLLNHAPLRCVKCGSVLNPFAVVDSSASTWICPFCFQRNQIAQRTSASDATFLAEISPQCTTVEYGSTPNERYGLPPAFMFVVDTCITDDELGFLKSELSQAFNLLPGDSLVGLITFGAEVHVHELGFSQVHKTFVFKGSKDVPKQMTGFLRKKSQAGVSDGAEDGFSSEPDSSGRFLLPASECKSTLDSVVEGLHRDPSRVTLDQSSEKCKGNVFGVAASLFGSCIPSPIPAHQRPIRCTGSALSVAATILGALAPRSQARILAFLGGPATEGHGAIVSKNLSESIRSHKDLDKGTVPHYRKAVKFYEGLGKQLLQQAHVLDVFACAVDQVGIAELKVAIERAGGLVFLGESFGDSMFRDSLTRVFQLGDQGLGLSSNCMFELNCSKDIKVQGILGPSASSGKRGSLCSGTLIGQGNTTVWKMCSLDKSTSICIIFENVRKEASDLFVQSLSNQFYFQLLSYYQHCSGEMRVRVTTLCRSVSRSGSTQELVAGFDPEAAAVVMARLISFRMESKAERDPVKWLDKEMICICSRFKDHLKDSSSFFSLSSKISIFLQFMFHLQRSQLVQVFSFSPDETAYIRMMLNRENVANSVLMIQPSLISYSLHSVPKPVPLDVAAIAADHILLLDAYFTVVIFHGSTIAQWRKSGSFHNQPDHEAYAQLLQAPHDNVDAITKERFPVPRLVICDQHDPQGRFLLAKLNPSATHVSGSHQTGGDILLTDDVSFDVFLDQLWRSAIQ